LKFAFMAILAMALLQQHDAWRDILIELLIEPAARRRAAIEARGHSEQEAFRTGGCKTGCKNQLACLSVCPSIWLSIHLSVRPSVTRWYCVKTTARSMVQFALSDSKMCLVL